MQTPSKTSAVLTSVEPSDIEPGALNPDCTTLSYPSFPMSPVEAPMQGERKSAVPLRSSGALAFTVEGRGLEFEFLRIYSLGL